MITVNLDNKTKKFSIGDRVSGSLDVAALRGSRIDRISLRLCRRVRHGNETDRQTLGLAEWQRKDFAANSSVPFSFSHPLDALSLQTTNSAIDHFVLVEAYVNQVRLYTTETPIVIKNAGVAYRVEPVMLEVGNFNPLNAALFFSSAVALMILWSTAFVYLLMFLLAVTGVFMLAGGYFTYSCRDMKIRLDNSETGELRASLILPHGKDFIDSQLQLTVTERLMSTDAQGNPQMNVTKLQTTKLSVLNAARIHSPEQATFPLLIPQPKYVLPPTLTVHRQEYRWKLQLKYQPPYWFRFAQTWNIRVGMVAKK